MVPTKKVLKEFTIGFFNFDELNLTTEKSCIEKLFKKCHHISKHFDTIRIVEQSFFSHPLSPGGSYKGK